MVDSAYFVILDLFKTLQIFTSVSLYFSMQGVGGGGVCGGGERGIK